MKQHYSMGFLFDPSSTVVNLIRKNRPTWMHGLLNGIGGKLEPGETYLQAMEREFREETGVSGLNWEHCVSMDGGSAFHMHVFSCHSDRSGQTQTTTDEAVMLVQVREVFSRAIPVVSNLPVLLALALDKSGISKPVLLQDVAEVAR